MTTWAGHTPHKLRKFHCHESFSQCRWEWIGFDFRKYICRSQDQNLFLIPFGQTSMKYNFSKNQPWSPSNNLLSTQSIKFKNRIASHEIRKYSKNEIKLKFETPYFLIGYTHWAYMHVNRLSSLFNVPYLQ